MRLNSEFIFTSLSPHFVISLEMKKMIFARVKYHYLPALDFYSPRVGSPFSSFFLSFVWLHYISFHFSQILSAVILFYFILIFAHFELNVRGWAHAERVNMMKYVIFAHPTTNPETLDYFSQPQLFLMCVCTRAHNTRGWYGGGGGVSVSKWMRGKVKCVLLCRAITDLQ